MSDLRLIRPTPAALPDRRGRPGSPKQPADRITATRQPSPVATQRGPHRPSTTEPTRQAAESYATARPAHAVGTRVPWTLRSSSQSSALLRGPDGRRRTRLAPPRTARRGRAPRANDRACRHRDPCSRDRAWLGVCLTDGVGARRALPAQRLPALENHRSVRAESPRALGVRAGLASTSIAGRACRSRGASVTGPNISASSAIMTLWWLWSLLPRAQDRGISAITRGRNPGSGARARVAANHRWYHLVVRPRTRTLRRRVRASAG